MARRVSQGALVGIGNRDTGPAAQPPSRGGRSNSGPGHTYSGIGDAYIRHHLLSTIRGETRQRERRVDSYGRGLPADIGDVCANSEGWRCVLCGRGLWWLGMRGLPETGRVEGLTVSRNGWLTGLAVAGSEGRPAKGPWQDWRFQLGSVVFRDECRTHGRYMFAPVVYYVGRKTREESSGFVWVAGQRPRERICTKRLDQRRDPLEGLPRKRDRGR